MPYFCFDPTLYPLENFKIDSRSCKEKASTPPPLPDKNNYLVWDTNPGEFVYLHVLKDCVKKLRFRYDLINYQLIYRYYMLLILIMFQRILLFLPS